MASRRGFAQNLPHMIKGSTVVGACTYQSQAARSYHNDEEHDAGDPTQAVGMGGRRDVVSTTTGREHVKRAGSPSLAVTSAGPSSPEKVISSKEVEEASRILFAPDDHHAGRQANESAAAGSAEDSLIPPPVRGPEPSPLARLHPKPAVHAEILRFGMALASNPKIQSAIRHELELHNGVEQMTHAEERGQEEMETAMRRLCNLREISSIMGDSFEVVGMSGSTTAAQDDEVSGMGMSSASFISLGRNIRRKDSLSGDVSEEVLDELLRSDDDDDAITQKMFAQTPDEHIRRYLRNLDMECVICHEYMVEATAVDCGEGHTFCNSCISRWLDEGKNRCPTCQKQVHTRVPMRQYDAMIEKYVRASNLWSDITSYYRRKAVSRMRRELEKEKVEEEEVNFFTAFGRRRRSRQNGRGSSSSTAGGGRGESSDQRGASPEPWWKSEVLQTALSVATMLILVVLFRRVKT